MTICCVQISIIQFFSQCLICSKNYMIFSQVMWLKETILVYSPGEEKISNIPSCKIWYSLRMLRHYPSTSYLYIFDPSCTKVSSQIWRSYVRASQVYLYSTTNKIQRFLELFVSINCSTRFRRFHRPSSGAQNCMYSVRYCQTNTAACRYCGWDGTHHITNHHKQLHTSPHTKSGSKYYLRKEKFLF